MTNLLEVDDTFSLTFKYSQEDVQKFADVTGDHNPIHLDPAYAEKTIFKKPIIHGFLGGSVFSKVLGTTFPGEGTIYLNQTMQFFKPMYVEDEYTAVFKVIEVNREKHRAKIETLVLDHDNKVVIKGEALVQNPSRL